MIPLITRRSLTRGRPRGFGKNRLMRRICPRDSRKSADIGYLRCPQNHITSSRVKGLDPSITVVIFLLRSGESSESMANHDSEIMVWLCSCRSDAGSSGVGTEGCERSDAAVVRAGANGGECRLVSGWVAQRGAA